MMPHLAEHLYDMTAYVSSASGDKYLHVKLNLLMTSVI
jgi:hypothetical protein